MSVPQSKDFSGARESASSPAVSKINVPAALAPRTHELYHFQPPRVNRRAPPNWREVSDTPRQNANSAPRLQTRCGIPSDFLGLHPTQDIMDEFLLATIIVDLHVVKPAQHVSLAIDKRRQLIVQL